MKAGVALIVSCLFLATACGDTPDQRARGDKDGGKNFMEPGKDDRVRRPPPKKEPAPKNLLSKNGLKYWTMILRGLNENAVGLTAKDLQDLSLAIPEDELKRLLDDLPSSKSLLLKRLRR